MGSVNWYVVLDSPYRYYSLVRPVIYINILQFLVTYTRVLRGILQVALVLQVSRVDSNIDDRKA